MEVITRRRRLSTAPGLAQGRTGRPLPVKTSDRRQLGVFQGQPLHAAAAEIHLHAGIRPTPLGGHDDADAKLGVLDSLADAQAAAVGFRITATE
jgi:hypothetical protein